MDENFVEAAFFGLIRRFVAEVPLAENPIRVSGRLEHLSQRRCLQAEPFALVDCVADTGTELMPAGHDAARVGEHVGLTWKSVKRTLAHEGVDMGRLDDRAAVDRKVAVTDVIGHHDHDVRAFRSASAEAVASETHLNAASKSGRFIGRILGCSSIFGLASGFLGNGDGADVRRGRIGGRNAQVLAKPPRVPPLTLAEHGHIPAGRRRFSVRSGRISGRRVPTRRYQRRKSGRVCNGR